MTTSSDPRPWRATLLAVPPERRSPFQRDLIRGIELSDFITRELETPVKPILTDPRVVKIMGAGVEAILLGPFEFSSLHYYMDQAVLEKLKSLVSKLSAVATVLLTCDALPEPRMCPALPVALSFLLHSLLMVQAEPDRPIVAVPDHFDTIMETLNSVSPAERRHLAQELTDAGCRLTPADIKEGLLYVHCQLMRNRQDPSDLNWVVHAAKDLILPCARAGRSEALPPWKALAARDLHSAIIKPFEGRAIQRHWGIQRDCEETFPLIQTIIQVSNAVLQTLEQLILAAERTGDPGLLAFSTALHLLELTNRGMDPKSPAEVKPLAEKAAAAFEAAKPWLPRFHQYWFNTSNIHNIVFSAPSHATMTSRAFLDVNCSREPQGGVTYGCARAPVALRKCAWCGAETMEMMACSGCERMHYCDREHQVSGGDDGESIGVVSLIF